MTTKMVVMKEYGYTQQKDDYIHTIGTCGQQLLDILHRLYGDDYPAEEISQKCRTLVTEKIRRDGPPTKRESRNFSHGSQTIIFHAAWHLPQSTTLSRNICVWQTSTTILHLLLAAIRYRVPNQTRIFF